MSKSKYPTRLDTSADIPAVRDNVTEISSDIINSIRSAIFAIEQTLGINPQGAIGNTVASRLSRSLDENGNITTTALSAANVLSGPILDSNVSSAAAIQESKLRLNFPTSVLQNQVSMLNSELNAIMLAIDDLSATLSAHIHPSALRRHKASAISADASTVIGADIAITEISSDNVQSVLEDLYNSHVNYTGANISSTNQSHLASQVFFDKTDVDSVISQDSVQGAIEDIANIQTVGLRDSIIKLHSNGRIRYGNVIDGFEGNLLGNQLVLSSEITYAQAAGASRTTIQFTEQPAVIDDISRFDILIISGSTNESNNKEYQIDEVTLDGSGNLSSVIIFGGPDLENTSGTTASIYKNTYVVYNDNGLNCTVRPRDDRTNTPDVLVAMPDAATITSFKIEPSKITSDSHKFDISIDENDPVTIRTYDASVAEQTLDSIVNKINEQAVDSRLNFSAFKLRVSNGYELALSHIVPNFSSDETNRTLKVSSASDDDGLAALGLSTYDGILVEGSTQNSYLINGLLLKSLGNIQTFTSDNANLIIGTSSVSLISDNFTDLGIRVGDIMVVTDSSDSTDDGSYRISSIIEERAFLDTSYTFDGSLTDDSQIHIIRCTAPVGELTFSESVSANGSILFDVFITEDSNIHYNKRLEIDGAIQGSSIVAAVVDVSRNFIISGDEASISVNTLGFATLTDPDLNVGEAVYIGASGTYKLFSADQMSFVILSVIASGPPSSLVTITLFGYDEISKNNLRISRGLFSTSLGRILGYDIEAGLPVVLDKRRSGTIDETIISESLLEKYIDGPRNELRSSGVIRGCEISDIQAGSGYYTFGISSGIIFVNGIRYEFFGYENFRVNTDSDFYVALDTRGGLVTGVGITNPNGTTDAGLTSVSPFFEQNCCTIGFVDISELSFIDLRLFVDRVDYKLTKEIIVAKSQEFGHYTNIADAVTYARRFTELFPDEGTPIIKIRGGEYTISEQVIIDFDVHIIGSGLATVITKTGSFASGNEPQSGNINIGDCAFLVGSSETEYSDRIINGVSFKDFTYSVSSLITNVGGAIGISQVISKASSTISDKATYTISGISFLGPSTINGDGVDADKIGEYALIVGQNHASTFAPESNLIMGNIIISNCRFDSIGLEKGAVKLTESASSEFKNIVAIGNIGTNMSPNLSDTTFEIIEPPTTPSVSEIIEALNVTSL